MEFPLEGATAWEGARTWGDPGLVTETIFHNASLFHTHNPALQWFGQMTPWCKRELREMALKVLGGDLGKRLLGADSALAPKPD